MSKQADTMKFYELLDELKHRIGGKRLFSDINAPATWLQEPGVYFIFEPGEDRSGSGESWRVVRVGKSSRPLKKRLREHRGNSNNGGDHRRSIFRKHVGSAFIQNGTVTSVESWGKRSRFKEASKPDKAAIREAECPVEKRVSEHIGTMWVIGVPVADKDKRACIEQNAIALLSGYLEVIDPPSKGWLGRDCCNHERVMSSGLWNNHHVARNYEPAFLNILEERINDA